MHALKRLKLRLIAIYTATKNLKIVFIAFLAVYWLVLGLESWNSSENRIVSKNRPETASWAIQDGMR